MLYMEALDPTGEGCTGEISKLSLKNLWAAYCCGNPNNVAELCLCQMEHIVTL